MIKTIYIILIASLLFSCQSESANDNKSNLNSGMKTDELQKVDVRTSDENHSINYKPVEEAIGIPQYSIVSLTNLSASISETQVSLL